MTINEFKDIQGYDDIKDIVKRALDAEDNYNARYASRPMFVYCGRSNCGESKTEIDRRVRGESHYGAGSRSLLKRHINAVTMYSFTSGELLYVMLCIDITG